MGYYSLLERCDVVKSKLTPMEFMEKWNESLQATEKTEDEGYLDLYRWEPLQSTNDGQNCRKYTYELQIDDWYAKHYADLPLAEFISRVIAPGESCILEFAGEDGYRWGYYIKSESVKEIHYVRMVDGRRID